MTLKGGGGASGIQSAGALGRGCRDCRGEGSCFSVLEMQVLGGASVVQETKSSRAHWSWVFLAGMYMCSVWMIDAVGHFRGNCGRQGLCVSGVTALRGRSQGFRNGTRNWGHIEYPTIFSD